jgi:hypothetical protein
LLSSYPPLPRRYSDGNTSLKRAIDRNNREEWWLIFTSSEHLDEIHNFTLHATKINKRTLLFAGRPQACVFIVSDGMPLLLVNFFVMMASHTGIRQAQASANTPVHAKTGIHGTMSHASPRC